MPARIIQISRHPRFKPKESAIPEVYVLDDDEESTIDEILEQIRVNEKE